IPSSPRYVYADFHSWRQVLNKSADSFGRLPIQYAPFTEVRRWVQSLARKENWSKVEYWRNFAKTNPAQLKAHRCPAAPDQVAEYQHTWRGWKDFLGTDKRAVKNYKQ